MSLTCRYKDKRLLDSDSQDIAMIMMCCNIGYLCEESIDELVTRVNLLRLSNKTVTTDDFKNHMGMIVNVKTISRNKWVSKEFKNSNYDQKWAEKLEKDKNSR